MLTFLSLFNPTTPNELAFFIAGGLGIFLYGINMMSDSLKVVAGNKLKLLIQKTTGTIFKGILTGALITVLIQSSSATTVIVVGLITAGLMNLRQAIGVIMGANIGTTITAFLIGLKIENYSLLFIAIGAILILFFNRQNIKGTGGILIGFGLLFLGLQLMSSALLQFQNSPTFKNAISRISNKWYLSIITGAILTAIIQSSSASIGILQQFYEISIQTGIGITLKDALGYLLGANIGTTITVMLASIGGSRESKQAALSHVLFNVLGALIFLIFLTPYTRLFTWVQQSYLPNNPKMTIAFAHIFFNVIVTIILFFFVDLLAKLVTKIIPAKESLAVHIADKLSDELLETSPVLALESAKALIVEMGQVTLEMFDVAHRYFNENNTKYIEECQNLERKIDFYDKVIHDYLIRMPTANLKSSTRLYQIIYLDTIRDFERIGDHCVNLVEFMTDRYEQGISITTNLQEEFNNFFNQVHKQIQNTIDCFNLKSITKAYEIVSLESEIDTLERKFRKSQFNLISAGHLSQEDIHYVDILSNLERISDHCFNIAQNIIDPFYMQRPDED